MKSEAQDEKDEVNFKELFRILIDDKWSIIAITTIALSLGIAKAMFDAPVYKIDALLKIEKKPKSLGDFTSTEDQYIEEIPVLAEIAIIKSRMVLGAAVEKLNLDVVAYPNYFSFLGKIIARKFTARNEGKISAPLFGYSEYAWGGEEIEIKFLEVPERWLGKKFALIAGKNGHFKVTHINKQLIAEGEVGKLLDVPVEGQDTTFQLMISIVKARPGTQFTISKRSRLDAIASLQKSLSVKELEEQTGILSFTMESETPLIAMQTMNHIADVYVRHNVEQKSGDAEKALSFLKDQVGRVKKQLEESTIALNEFRKEKGSIDFNAETQEVLSSVVGLKSKITLLEQSKDELHRNFTSSHPSVIAIDKQISRLRSQLYSHNKKIKNLPETQQSILRLSRNVKVDTQLYTALLKQLQAIKVTKAGTIGDVKIIDYAVLPSLPFKPRKPQIAIISLILGLLFGVITTLIRKASKHGVDDPKLIEKHLKLPVYATIPHSDFQQSLSKKQGKIEHSDDNTPNILALLHQDDSAIESLRSLRTTFHFAMLEAKNNIVLICGPSPDIGKTFISTNLAVLLALSGKKILLIDGDMRKGALNKVLGIDRKRGLSELISNAIEPSEAIRTVDDVDIDFISTGVIPPNPSELLLNPHFEELITGYSKDYDLVIIDSPPILAVADASIIGRLAGTSLMVVRAGEHSIDDLELCVKRFNQNKVDIKGIVFNDLPESLSSYGYEKYSY